MAKYDDFRIIFKSNQIVNSPFAMLNTMPADLQASIKDAFFNIQKNDPEAFQVMTDGEQQLWVPATNAEYQVIIDLNTFVDTHRKS